MMAFNSDKTISMAIESCLNQTFRDIEICIADDASTDNTVSIIKKYQEMYPDKIKLIVQPFNMGIYSLAINGNACLSICKSDYIAWLDADEQMEVQRLERQMNFLDNNANFIAVSHNKLNIDSVTCKSVTVNCHNFSKREITTKDLILKGNVFHSCFMMRNIGIRLDTSLKVMSDWELIIRLSLIGKLGFQDEFMTVKYWHDTNVTRTRLRQFSEDSLITLALLEHKYPELLHYIDIRRTGYYLHAIKTGDLRYFRGLIGFRFISVLRSIINKYW